MGSLAIHLIVPAMPEMARSLDASPDRIKLAITLYLIGLGGGQLLAGVLIDRLGRRPILILGVLVFAVGSLAAALAPTDEAFLFARVLQAAGGAAGIVAARTIIADLSAPEAIAGNLSILMALVLLSPAIAPVLGGAIVSLSGWRWCLGALFIASGAALLLAALFLPESRPSDQQTSPLRSWRQLSTNLRFVRYVLAIAASSAALYIFLSGSAFLLERYGLGPTFSGVCYALIALSGVAGALLVNRLEDRGGAFRIGLAAIATGGATMTLLALTGHDNTYALIGPMLLAGLGAGLCAPSGMAGAMQAIPGMSGTAASLAGASQMIATGLLTSALATLQGSSLLQIGGGILICGCAAYVIAPKGRASGTGTR